MNMLCYAFFLSYKMKVKNKGKLKDVDLTFIQKEAPSKQEEITTSDGGKMFTSNNTHQSKK